MLGQGCIGEHALGEPAKLGARKVMGGHAGSFVLTLILPGLIRFVHPILRIRNSPAMLYCERIFNPVLED